MMEHPSILCPYCGARKQRRTDPSCKYPDCQKKARIDNWARRVARRDAELELVDRPVVEGRRPLLVGVLVCCPLGRLGLRLIRPCLTDADEDDAVVIQWPVAEAIASWTVEQFLAVQAYIRAQRY